jgi:DNA-binding beta-propeller fold protein YncE
VLSYDGKDFDFIRLIEAGLREPIGVASYQGALIVADTGNDLVKAIIPEGNIQVVFVFPGPNDDYTGPFSRPQGVIADAQGNIVVADTGNRRVATIRGAFPPPKAFRWLPLIAK